MHGFVRDMHRHLDLSGNLLTGTIPPTLVDLVDLTYFDASSNEFTGPVPDVFDNFTLLR